MHHFALSTLSLGASPPHSLYQKLSTAAEIGVKGVEIFYADLQHLASTFPITPASSTPSTPWRRRSSQFSPEPLHNLSSTNPSEDLPRNNNERNEILAAQQIGQWCSSLQLSVISLQPCFVEEGTLNRQQWRNESIPKARHWIRMAQALETDLILIPSSISQPQTLSGNLDDIARDLREVADMGAKYQMRFAYEALCFGSHVDLWERSLEVVNRVGRDNLGLCLDAFNIAGRVYADPSREDGVALTGREDIIKSVANLAALSAADAAKIWIFQVVDGERLDVPMGPENPMWVEEWGSRKCWSRNCRSYYGEGYLPVQDIIQTVCKSRQQGGCGYQGFVSFELFNRDLSKEGDTVVADLGRRAKRSWQLMSCECGLISGMKQESGRKAAPLNNDRIVVHSGKPCTALQVGNSSAVVAA